MSLKILTKEQWDIFIELCRSHQVDKVYAFGSSITERFDDKSDVDLLVTVNIKEPADRGESLLSLWDKLEVLFGRKVDLLTDDSIRNPILRANIDRTKRLIYDRNDPTLNLA